MSTVDVSIISSGASLADARLHRITNALIRSGLTVEILAPGKSTDAPLGAVVRSVHQGKGFSWRMHRAFYSPWRSQGKVLYCLAPEAQFFTWLASAIRRRKYCADIYEDYLSLLRDRAWARKFFGLPGFIATLITQSSTYFSSKACLTTVADIQVPPFKAKNRLVLRNLPDKSHLTESGSLDSQPRALYIGDLRKSRGLFTMLESAERAIDWHFDIVGPLSENDRAQVEVWQREHPQAAQRVTFHGRLSPDKAWSLAKGAWVGLSLLEPTPAFIAAVPSKLYEYMSVGLAVISTPLPRCAQLISISGCGEVSDGPESTAAILNKWQAEPNLLERHRASALSWSATNLDAESEYGAMVEAVRLIV